MLNRKTYYLKPAWRIMLVTASVFLLIALAVVLRNARPDSSTPLEIIGLISLLGGLGGIGLYEAVFNRIVTSAEGIEYHCSVYKNITSWSNVKSVETNPFGIVNLTLHESALSGVPPFSWYSQFFGFDRRIQLSPYIGNWKRSQLIQDIKQYAPHAFRPPSTGLL